jgi:hypothetical protein
MDNAVALVRAYLHANGYFTVTEHPVLEAERHSGFRTVTDLDVLAFRFPGAGRRIYGVDAAAAGRHGPAFAPDPALGVPGDRSDMLVAEVKEGRARFNEAMRDPAALEAALARFGCCAPEQARGLANELLGQGHATLPSGHEARLAVFASTMESPGRPGTLVVGLGHVVRFLREHLRAHWPLLKHAQLKDPALGFLATLEKALREPEPAPASLTP